MPIKLWNVEELAKNKNPPKVLIYFNHMLLLLTSVKSDNDLFKIEIAIIQIKISLTTVSLVY